MKKRFVIAGTSNRGMNSYGKPLVPTVQKQEMGENFGYGDDSQNKKEFSDASELVGVYDINIGRARYVADQLHTVAYEDFDTQKLNIDVSQRVFESTSNKFEYGHASSLELTNASMTLLTAQSDYVQAILNLVNAQIELKKLLNK